MLPTSPFMTILVKELHPEKAFPFISLILLFKLKLFKEVQLANAPFPNSLISPSITTLDKLEQLENAPVLISIPPFSVSEIIFTLVRLVQLPKEYSSIYVIGFGKVTLDRLVQL